MFYCENKIPFLNLIDIFNKFLERRSYLVFENLIIGQNQKDFEKYIKIKGKFLFKQVYDFLLSIPGNKNATYDQVSSCIRYDKNLRDKLYIYLATFEEFLRAKIFDKYDIKDAKYVINKKDENYISDLYKEIIKTNDNETSNLYNIFNLDLGDTISIVQQLQMFDQKTIEEFHKIRKLRNEVMHHNLIILGKETILEKVKANQDIIKKYVISLANQLPEGYKDNFIDDINRLRCDVPEYKIILGG